VSFAEISLALLFECGLRADKPYRSLHSIAQAIDEISVSQGARRRHLQSLRQQAGQLLDEFRAGAGASERIAVGSLQGLQPRGIAVFNQKTSFDQPVASGLCLMASALLASLRTPPGGRMRWAVHHSW
jgi:hypothetical protein